MARTVWVWLGNVRPDFDAGAYVEFDYSDEDRPESGFTKGFGLEWYDEDFQEVIKASSPLPVRDLLRDMSYSHSYLDEVEKAASAVGIHAANLGVLIFDEDFSFSGQPDRAGDVVYVGEFAWSE